MISGLIFTLHLIFMIYIFTKKWQDESLGTAFSNIALIIILFTVGWSISSSLFKIIIDQKGLGIQFDRDTIALTALSIVEYLFYRFYYREEEVTEAGTEK